MERRRHSAWHRTRRRYHTIEPKRVTSGKHAGVNTGGPGKPVWFGGKKHATVTAQPVGGGSGQWNTACSPRHQPIALPFCSTVVNRLPTSPSTAGLWRMQRHRCIVRAPPVRATANLPARYARVNKAGGSGMSEAKYGINAQGEEEG